MLVRDSQSQYTYALEAFRQFFTTTFRTCTNLRLGPPRGAPRPRPFLRSSECHLWALYCESAFQGRSL